MTILEAQYKYGTKDYMTSEGDSITSIVRKIYGSYGSIEYRIISILNPRYDWWSLPSGELIKYIPPQYVSNISELV